MPLCVRLRRAVRERRGIASLWWRADIGAPIRLIREPAGSFDDDALDSRSRRWKLGVHGFQGVDQQVDYRPIPIPLVVGGNHEPRGEVVGARLDDAAVLSHEVVPSLTRIEVGGRELPTLVGLVDSLLHALALLVLGDVQEDFHYGRSGFDQVLLEGMDGLQPPFLLGGVDEVQDAGGDDVLVMAPIEDPDLATTGERTIDPPEELVLEFLAHWRAKAAHRNALRVNTPEHPADSTVLASCVERLENEQERAFGFGPEPPLQRLETEMQGENRLVQFGLSLGDTWGARALQLVEVKARSGLYAQVLFGMREFRGLSPLKGKAPMARASGR